MTTAVIMLSGGLDSAVTAWMVKGTGLFMHTVSFAYGQRHMDKELAASKRLAEILDVTSHRVIELPIDSIIGNKSSLILGSVAMPRTGGIESRVPDTWVPQRNTIFLTFAAALAEVLEARKIYTGFNAIDYSGYPDCRPEFVFSMEEVLNLARGKDPGNPDGDLIQIVTPIIDLSKMDIVKLGQRLGVPFESTYSCYYGRAKSCGKCDSCRIRLQAFSDLGLPDPILYES